VSARAILTVGFILLVHSLCLGQVAGKSQQDSAARNSRSPFRFDPSFRSIQLDAATFVFSHAASASIDVDLATFTQGSAGKIGFRFGAEWSGAGGAGGDQEYYRDLNAFVRVTAAGERGRFDLLFGTCSRRKAAWGIVSAGDFVAKLGAEARLNLSGNYFGLFGKGSITRQFGLFGVGLFIGVDTWH
jgi:hypothetical protein